MNLRNTYTSAMKGNLMHILNTYLSLISTYLVILKINLCCFQIYCTSKHHLASIKIIIQLKYIGTFCILYVANT